MLSTMTYGNRKGTNSTRGWRRQLVHEGLCQPNFWMCHIAHQGTPRHLLTPVLSYITKNNYFGVNRRKPRTLRRISICLCFYSLKFICLSFFCPFSYALSDDSLKNGAICFLKYMFNTRIYFTLCIAQYQYCVVHHVNSFVYSQRGFWNIQ